MNEATGGGWASQGCRHYDPADAYDACAFLYTLFQCCSCGLMHPGTLRKIELECCQWDWREFGQRVKADDWYVDASHYMLCPTCYEAGRAFR
jgi:hypothetical protein